MSGEFTPCLLRASPAPKGTEKEWLRLYTKASFGISSSVPMARPDRLWGQAASRGTQSTFYRAGLDLKKPCPNNWEMLTEILRHADGIVTIDSHVRNHIEEG